MGADRRLGQEEKVGDLGDIVSAVVGRGARVTALTIRWAGAMVGSFALVSRNNYQSFSTRLVQARVYAQGKSP